MQEIKGTFWNKFWYKIDRSCEELLSVSARCDEVIFFLDW